MGCTVAAKFVPVGIVGRGQGHAAAGIDQLADGAEMIAQEVFRISAVHLGDTAQAVNIVMGPVLEDLGEGGGQVEAIGGREAVEALLEAVAEAAVGKGGGARPSNPGSTDLPPNAFLDPKNSSYYGFTIFSPSIW